MKKETMKTAMGKYEGSEKDKRKDAAGAKKMGVSKAAYEKTAKDKREDTKEARKMMAKDNAKRGKKY